MVPNSFGRTGFETKTVATVFKLAEATSGGKFDIWLLFRVVIIEERLMNHIEMDR